MTTGALPRRRVRGTNLSYASLADWLELVYRVGARIECSRRHYTRCRRLYRSLYAGDIRASRDIRSLEACERLFNRARGFGGSGSVDAWPVLAARPSAKKAGGEV
jgi:hypothetical protein